MAEGFFVDVSVAIEKIDGFVIPFGCALMFEFELLDKEIDRGSATILAIHITHEDECVDVELFLHGNIQLSSRLNVIIQLLQDLLALEGAENIHLGNLECT